MRKDAFTPYEAGLTYLLERLDRDHPRSVRRYCLFNHAYGRMSPSPVATEM